jgi:hypothetical protein
MARVSQVAERGAEAGARATTGGCSCGAVSYRCAGAPVWTAYCHCGDCRRATGAPVSLWIGFPARSVELAGPAAWRVGRSASVARAFCGICGSPVAYRDTTILDDEIYLAAGTLDHPEAVTPEAHAFWRERLPYLALVDELPRFDTFSRRGVDPTRRG